MNRFSKALFLLFIVIIPHLASSQHTKPQRDFSRIDSFARTVKYKGNLVTLTKQLTDPYPDHLSKTRSIFIWITDHIAYDYKTFNSGRKPKLPKCRPGMNCEQQLAEWENKYLHRCIKKGKAVCEGYSRLFKRMCDLAGIRSEIVPGYTKQKSYEVGLTGSLDHAWNVVWLDSAYFFIDPTWAAGSGIESESTGKLLGFVKSLDEYYWLTPFSDLTRNHYPKDAKWVLAPNYTKEKYAANPYYSNAIISKIRLISPGSGVIKVNKGDTIHFRFEYRGDINYLQVNSNVYYNPKMWNWEQDGKRKVAVQDTVLAKKQRYVNFTRKDDLYEFDYVVTDGSLYYLEILFDYNTVMRFKVSVAK